MTDPSMAIVNFYFALEELEFNVYKRVLIARDIPGEYMNLMTSKPHVKKAIFIFETRDDIVDLCREEEKRMEELTGEKKKIDDKEVVAVFVWNQTFGIVKDVPLSEERWQRYFKMDIDAPCILCDGVNKKRTICGNCTSVVCLECDEKLTTTKCPGCTLSMESFSV